MILNSEKIIRLIRVRIVKDPSGFFDISKKKKLSKFRKKTPPPPKTKNWSGQGGGDIFLGTFFSHYFFCTSQKLQFHSRMRFFSLFRCRGSSRQPLRPTNKKIRAIPIFQLNMSDLPLKIREKTVNIGTGKLPIILEKKKRLLLKCSESVKNRLQDIFLHFGGLCTVRCEEKQIFGRFTTVE